MSEEEIQVWGIHGRRTGDADSLFAAHDSGVSSDSALKKNVVAIGWHAMGDLSKHKADQEAFRQKVAETYPGKKPGAIPNEGGRVMYSNEPTTKRGPFRHGLAGPVARLARLQTETVAELDALLPSILDRAFAGAL